jgi:hypothetical protein
MSLANVRGYPLGTEPGITIATPRDHHRAGADRVQSWQTRYSATRFNAEGGDESEN